MARMRKERPLPPDDRVYLVKPRTFRYRNGRNRPSTDRDRAPPLCNPDTFRAISATHQSAFLIVGHRLADYEAAANQTNQGNCSLVDNIIPQHSFLPGCVHSRCTLSPLETISKGRRPKTPVAGWHFEPRPGARRAGWVMGRERRLATCHGAGSAQAGPEVRKEPTMIGLNPMSDHSSA